MKTEPARLVALLLAAFTIFTTFIPLTDAQSAAITAFLILAGGEIVRAKVTPVNKEDI